MRGLKKLPKDKRDFSLKKHFGSILNFPLELLDGFEPLEIKDQGGSDFCADCGIAECAEPHEGIIFDEVYSAMCVRRLQGNPPTFDGSDLRTAMRAGTKYGFLPKKDAPYKIDDPRGYQFICNPDNWDLPKYDALAAPYKQESFFEVDGPYDLFDNIRSTLYRFKDKNDFILTGLDWHNSWTGLKDGMIPRTINKNEFTSAHAFVFTNKYKLFPGETDPRIRAQLSNGTYFGGIGGYFWFPREVVNQLCTYGNYVYKDINPSDVKSLQWTYIQLLRQYLSDLLILARNRGIVVALGQLLGFPEK